MDSGREAGFQHVCISFHLLICTKIALGIFTPPANNISGYAPLIVNTLATRKSKMFSGHQK